MIDLNSPAHVENSGGQIAVVCDNKMIAEVPHKMHQANEIANKIALEWNKSTVLMPPLEQYQEFEPLVNYITNMVASEAESIIPSIQSDIPYKMQFVLEEVIKKLQILV